MEMPNSLNSYILHLERLLGRRWGDDDFARTMQRLQRVSTATATATVEAEVNLEVAHLGGGLAPAAADELASILPKYYAILLQAWSVITEPHPPTMLDDADFPNLSVVVPPPGTFDDDDDDDDNIFLDDLLEDEGDDEDGYSIVYDVDDNVSIEDTLAFHSCKIKRYGDQDTDEANDEEADNCSICLDRLHQGLVATLDCNHAFHGECIITWVVRGRNFCPLYKAKALRGSLGNMPSTSWNVTCG